MSSGPYLPPDEGGGSLPPATPYIPPQPPPQPYTAPPPQTAPTNPAPPIPQQGAPILPPDTTGGGYTPLPTVTPTTPPPTTTPTDTTTTTTVSTQGQPIPRSGQPQVEIDTGNVITAPNRTDLPAGSPEQTPSDLPTDAFPDFDERFLSGVQSLSGMPFVQYVRNGCDNRNLDDLAVFANALAEGIHGGVGDDGTSFGPWQLHQNGALPKKYWTRPAYDPATQAWAWSRQGIDYALDSMVKADAAGRHGHNAVETIVRNFERPGNIGGQIVVRDDYYDQLAKMGDPYGFLATQAAGPKGSGATTAPTPAPAKPTGTGVVASWRDLLDSLVTQTGRAQTAVNSVHTRLVKAVK